MASGSLKLLKGVLWFIAAFHIGVGFGLNVSEAFPRVMAVYYGARGVDWTQQFLYVLKPLGAFMFVLGCLAAVAAMNPLRQREIVYAFAGLFVLRALQRLVFAEQIYRAFEIPPQRNIMNMIFFLAMGVFLFLLHRYVEKQSALQTSR